MPPTNPPEPISELIGRDDVLREVISLASAHRLVTLTDAGGIDKTRLAVAAARRLLPQFADGVWLAEFSPIADPSLVAVTVAAVIGLHVGGGEVSAQRVSQALGGRVLVLVLDTCEHVIGAAAALAESVLRAGGTLHLLATNREPLRAEGEWVYPVAPLAVPAEDAVGAASMRFRGSRYTSRRHGSWVIMAHFLPVPINTMIMTFGNFPGSHLLSTVLTVSSLTPNGLACRLGVKLRPDLSLSLGQQSPGKQTPS